MHVDLTRWELDWEILNFLEMNIYNYAIPIG